MERWPSHAKAEARLVDLSCRIVNRTLGGYQPLTSHVPCQPPSSSPLQGPADRAEFRKELLAKIQKGAAKGFEDRVKKAIDNGKRIRQVRVTD